VGVNEKLPVDADVTVRENVVVALNEPDVPVMVIVLVAVAAVPPAVKVNTLLPVAGLVPKEPVTPVGKPDAARVTELENGLTSVTVMVSVPLAPWEMDSPEAEGFSEKLPDPPPPDPEPLTEQAVPLSEKAVGTAFVLPFQVPLNPMPVRLAPAARLPL
jgi:hypothetical protein